MSYMATENSLAIDVESTMQALNRYHRCRVGSLQTCVYHTSYLKQAGSASGLSPWDRFISNDSPSEQPGLYHGPQFGTLSTTKPCACGPVNPASNTEDNGEALTAPCATPMDHEAALEHVDDCANGETKISE
jgi:hypothetical protein